MSKTATEKVHLLLEGARSCGMPSDEELVSDKSTLATHEDGHTRGHAQTHGDTHTDTTAAWSSSSAENITQNGVSM
eukprot:326112-Amphidinium_carterae.1